MRPIPEALAARLNAETATLCRCWRVDRQDGVSLGFTDHDADIVIDGITYRAETGLSGGELEASTGLSVNTQSVIGALDSASITERDVLKGLFDNASVTQFLVDWTDPSISIELSVGRIGEIRRTGTRFEAEIVSLSDRLNQPIGRAYIPTCSLRLGEEACGVDLDQGIYTGVGTVGSILQTGSFTVEGIDQFETTWFDNGFLVWTSGENEGSRARIRMHRTSSQGAQIDLWSVPVFPVQQGDTVRLTAGCDKSFPQCRERFNNALNFRGFPHLPGSDWVNGYAEEGGAHDGGSLFRS